MCLYSEVFVTTQGGNFPHFLMGHRRFLFDGHSKTINPDKRKLVLLLQDMNVRYALRFNIVSTDISFVESSSDFGLSASKVQLLAVLQIF